MAAFFDPLLAFFPQKGKLVSALDISSQSKQTENGIIERNGES